MCRDLRSGSDALHINSWQGHPKENTVIRKATLHRTSRGHRHRPTAVVGHQPINISLIPILRCEVTNVQHSLIRHSCCRGSPTCCAKSDERFLCVGTTKSTISNQLSLSRWLVSIRRRAEIGSENVQRTIPGNRSNCKAGRQAVGRLIKRSERILSIHHPATRPATLATTSVAMQVRMGIQC